MTRRKEKKGGGDPNQGKYNIAPIVWCLLCGVIQRLSNSCPVTHHDFVPIRHDAVVELEETESVQDARLKRNIFHQK